MFAKAQMRRLRLLLCALLLSGVFLLCVCVGSVSIPLEETLSVILRALRGHEVSGSAAAILLRVRLPRVCCVGLTGAALSLCGAAMQGLLRNPLADGSTLGVSAGASLGAVVALAFDITLPGLPLAGTMVMAMLFGFLSLLLILSLAFALDRSFSTHSIILIGIIFSMFASALMSLVISFAGEKIKSITFWTMGSLSGSNWRQACILLAALLLSSLLLLRLWRELNAFAVGEDNARAVGVNLRAVKLCVLIVVSVLIGICVSIGGTISFVGLVTPHMAHMVVGPNHRRLLPASMFSGAVFLMLADLIARTLLSPVELSIGVVTSLVGAAAFVWIFRATKGGKTPC